MTLKNKLIVGVTSLMLMFAGLALMDWAISDADAAATRLSCGSPLSSHWFEFCNPPGRWTHVQLDGSAQFTVQLPGGRVMHARPLGYGWRAYATGPGWFGRVGVKFVGVGAVRLGNGWVW